VFCEARNGVLVIQRV